MLDITKSLTTHTSDCDSSAHVLHDAVGYRKTHSGTLVTFLLAVFMHVVHQKGPLSVYCNYSTGSVPCLSGEFDILCGEFLKKSEATAELGA